MFQINCYLENGDKMVYPKAFDTERQAQVVIGGMELEDDEYGVENKYEIIEIGVDKTSKV